MNRLLVIVAFGALLLCACSKTKDPQAGSQTHFLADCSSRCPDPYACLCGVCTLPCTGSAQCGDAHEDAVCIAPADSGGTCSSAKICDRECTRDADCSALGSGFRCEDERCRQTMGGDAGSSAGTGGAQGGQGGMAGAQGGRGGSTGGSGGSGVPARCELPAVSGPCDAAFPRFHYDAAAGRCQPFTWGGCEANANNFETLAACESACGTPSSGGECSVSGDCTLIPVGCCSACNFEDPALFEAVPLARRDAEIALNCPSGPPACGACAPYAFDPEWPVLHARCTAGECQAVDLREDPQTSCANDDECTVVKAGCCNPCSDEPAGWVAMRADISAEYPEGMTCLEIPCPECVGAAPPKAFCADDGHCAIRETARAGGTLSSTCFSPNQNLEDAYEPGAVGCDCAGNASGASVCRQDSTGRDVALTCGERWMSVEDGACEP